MCCVGEIIFVTGAFRYANIQKIPEMYVDI